MENTYPTTTAKAALHEVTSPLLSAMYDEFKDLSKKKPDGAVSKSKIEIVNRLLKKCKEVLKDELSIDYLDLIDEVNVPQNSDIVLMLSQYVAAMHTFRSLYYGHYDGDFRWHTSQE